MLAYFFAFRYIMEIYISQKRQFCLGSITKCDVIRTGGGLQSRAKNKAPFEKLRLADFFHNGAMVFLEFRFLCVLGGLQTPQDGLQEVDGICDASLASRDCKPFTGEHKRDGNRMNSSKRFTVRYIGLCPC